MKSLSLLALALLAPTGSAQQLLVGGPDTIIRRALPVSGAFDIIGACGGIVESMVSVGDMTYIGDRSGILYVHDPAVGVQYSFNTQNDAAALASDGQRLFVGGSDGSVECYDLTTELLLGTWRAPAGLRALTRVGHDLFAAGDSGVVTRASLLGGGNFQTFGDAAMPVTAMTSDGSALLLGSATGTISRMDLGLGSITGSFQIGSDVTALGMSLDQLLVAAESGIVRRVDPVDGTVFDSHEVGSSVRALSLTDGVQPGVTYCYGVQCPCGNDDPLAGCVNSTGRGARLALAGTSRVSSDDLALYITGAPANSTTIVFMGDGSGLGTVGNGLLCVGGSVGLQRFDAGQTNAFGAYLVDGVAQQSMAQFSSSFQITAGSTWHFQAWYRDSGGACGASSNVTNSSIIGFTQ
ncbi:hypothetical protein Poly30_04350 [Planctomycetes bacterium Poly30]|uniref:Uncharacterized protein n=1 Tax=Saltatorellus ferox TaxID=2528018 RepID=A0A518ELH4_9BACT|nr:hypothetical protein Poly30_04350 [Planctomycetes bacterium Poly30]